MSAKQELPACLISADALGHTYVVTRKYKGQTWEAIYAHCYDEAGARRAFNEVTGTIAIYHRGPKGWRRLRVRP